MKTARTDIFKRLQKEGYRLTDARKEVVQLLLSAESPHTAQMISERVTVDEASVYRTLALFQKLGIIEEIVEPGSQRRYSIAEGHHHHIVCTLCGLVVHIPCADGGGSVGVTSVADSRFPVILGHDVTYYGYCQKCT